MFSFIGLIAVIFETINYISSSNQNIFSKSGLLIILVLIFQVASFLAHWGYELTNNKSHDLTKEYFRNGEDKLLLEDGASKLFTHFEDKETKKRYEFYIPTISIALDLFSIIITLLIIDKTASYKSYIVTLLCVIGLFVFNLFTSYRTAYLIHRELDMKVKRIYK